MWLGLAEPNDSPSVANLSCAFCNITIPWIVNRLFSCPHCSSEYCSREHKKADARFHRLRCRGVQNEGDMPVSSAPFPYTNYQLPQNHVNLLGGFNVTPPADGCSGFTLPACSDNSYGLDQYLTPMDVSTPASLESPSPTAGDCVFTNLLPAPHTNNKHTTRTFPLPRSKGPTEGTQRPLFNGISSNSCNSKVNSAILNFGQRYGGRQNDCQAKLSLKEVALFMVNSLQQNYYCILDNFNGSDLANCICKETEELYYNGAFSDGQTSSSKSTEGAINRSVREDQVAWVNGQEHSAIQRHMVRLDKLMSTCNEYLDGVEISKSRTHAMVACYPGGGTGYKEHVDNPCKDGRCITTLYYVNPGWNAQKDGGVLTLFPNSNDRPPVHVEPNMDRLLIFWSDRRTPHKVNPAYKTRFAITLWYFDQEERKRYMNRTIVKQT